MPSNIVDDLIEELKQDPGIAFLDSKDTEELTQIGLIQHEDVNSNALNVLFQKLQRFWNPQGNIAVLNNDNNNSFIGISNQGNYLSLISNRKYISPKLLMRALSFIITIIYDHGENKFPDTFFGEKLAEKFKLSGLSANILSQIPEIALNKMISIT